MKTRTQHHTTARNLLLVSAIFLLPLWTHAASVLDSKHNLSMMGPGTVKASSETEVCIFCHAPHHSSTDGPLWNQQSSKASYITYTSPTMKATVGQPNGASKLCLSCHDGTVALGMINSQSTPIAMLGSVKTMQGATNVGTDLSNSHPVSFTFNSALSATAGHLCDPSTLTGKVRLDSSGQMQCTACHNPHDNQYGNFLVMANTGSTLCTTCHNDSLLAASTHLTSSTPITNVSATLAAPSAVSAPSASSASASLQSKPKTMAANGCNNCHSTHGAAGRKRLLLSGREEKTCFACHDGKTVNQPIAPEFNKISVHPVLTTSQLHDAGEDLVNAPRHVACADCHNSHAVKSSKVQSAGLSVSLLGTKGVNRSGSVVDSVSNEYELCFRCHGDSVTRNPVNVNSDPASVNRVSSNTNMRQAFTPGNRSYHPVVAIGKSTDVPSLLSPYTTGSTIKCTSCHNNDQGPGAGGSGPKGPHGSSFSPILERRQVTTDYIGESAANYALCYKCHSRDSILSDQSFRATNRLGQSRGHRFHIVDQKAACSTCHDSHGVAYNKHLINFNANYVTQSSTGRIEYNSTGPLRGNCTLTCHKANHLGAAYPGN